VDRSADSVVFKVLHLQAFEDNSLAGESGITVDDDGNYLTTVLLFAAEEVLLGANTTRYDGVYGFQMGRVGHESQLNFDVGIFVSPVQCGTKMVLYVTCSLHETRLGRSRTLELSHDDFHRLAHDVGQYI